MAPYRYLKEESYYSDNYDHATIKECRWWEAQGVEKRLAEKVKTSKDKKVQEQYAKGVALPNVLYIIQGERFRHKAETVREWMDRDRAKDNKVASAIQPPEIRCLTCGLTMECIDRDLMTSPAHKDEQVLFMFTCSHCKRGRALWEGGEEWHLPPTPCPKCKTPMTDDAQRVGNVVTTTYTCPKCHHTESRKINFDEKYVEPVDPHFEEDRKKYCLSQEEGSDYVYRMDSMKRLVDEWKEKEKHKDLYDAVAKIKILPIAELQTLLNPIIQKAGYTNFVIGKPEVLRGVTVEFSLRDNQVGRSQHDSAHGLEKLLQKALEGTNWRLMSDGVRYTLGFLNGRLRGVEGEEELLELAKRRLKEIKAG